MEVDLGAVEDGADHQDMANAQLEDLQERTDRHLLYALWTFLNDERRTAVNAARLERGADIDANVSEYTLMFWEVVALLYAEAKDVCMLEPHDNLIIHTTHPFRDVGVTYLDYTTSTLVLQLQRYKALPWTRPVDHHFCEAARLFLRT